jgi:primosomal protein N' (replication factor Y)
MPTHSPTNERLFFADLVLPLAIPKMLTYHVPPHLMDDLQVGSRVIVSLGNQKVITGIVSKLHTTVPPYPTKAIIDLLDPAPILTTIQLTFFQWMAQYYMCTLGEVLKAALPSGLKVTSQSRIYLHAAWDEGQANLTPQEQLLIQALKNKLYLSYQQVEQLIGPKGIYKLLKGLLDKKAILILEEVQEKYLPKLEKQVSLHQQYVNQEQALQALFKQLDKSPKQQDVLLEYISLVASSSTNNPSPWISKKQLLQQEIASHALQSLLKRNIFIERTVAVSRLVQRVSKALPDIALSEAQCQALTAIRRLFRFKNTVLLHGITGSGKTEIYIQLIQEVIQQEGQVLFLLPEIGLTTQIVQRLKDRFGDIMEVYHSKYSSDERVEIWNKLLHQEVRLVIGVRSALLLPFHRLQLIIVDEEHEAAYKQFDSSPRYHARDAALMLATYYQAKVLLGSATPAIETYHHAMQGKYGLVKLTERFSQTPLPRIDLINLRIEQQRKRLQGEFTSPLLQALESTLQQHQQAIIFQNRRGYATCLFCQECAWVATCQHCSVSLTYHQFKDYLTCHYCGYHQQMPSICPICGALALKQMGYGTEKVTETLQQFFPDKQVVRMDADTTRKKHSYEQIIANLEKGHTNILVGTQMITKGLDFGDVSLVGVLDIDRLLYFPDFRANEHCFQLLTQVSGRAGRRNKQGQVIIQTLNPQHPILQEVVSSNYEQMYRRELLERQKFRYPPYVRLIKLTCQHVHEHVVQEAASLLAQELHRLINSAHILGPQAPLIAKIKNQYRMDIWIKLPKATEHSLYITKQQIQQITLHLLSLKSFRQVRVSFDVDPL